MTPSTALLRRASSIVLAVSFVAMATSGLVMLVAERLSLQLRMHPVHNVFGLVMLAAGVLHALFNWSALAGYLRVRWAGTLGFVLLGVVAALFVVGLTSPMDDPLIGQMEELMTAARRAQGER